MYAQCSPETVRRAAGIANNVNLPEHAQVATHNYNQNLVVQDTSATNSDAVKVRPGPMCLVALSQSRFFQQHQLQQIEPQTA